MVAAFPVAKLGFLLVKQVSKPIAKRIAERAKKSPFFANWVCIPTANLFHWYEIKLKLRMMNMGSKVTKVPKLNEAKAIEQGSEILSEFTILFIAGAILVYEYNRSSEKEEAKEERLKQDRLSLKNRIVELELKVERQTIQIKSLTNQALELKTDIYNHSLRRRLLDKKPELPAELTEEEMNKPILVPVDLGEELGLEPGEVIVSRKDPEDEDEDVEEKVPINKIAPAKPLVESNVNIPEKPKDATKEVKNYDETQVQKDDDNTHTGVRTEAVTLYEKVDELPSSDSTETKSSNEMQLKHWDTSSNNNIEIVKPGVVTGAIQYYMNLGKL